MMKLTKYLKSLPGVRATLAGKMIRARTLLTDDQRADLYRTFGPSEPIVLVGPIAAQALLSAYQEGQLPMLDAAMIEDAPIARAYLEKGELLAKDAAARRATLERLANLGTLSPEDLWNWHTLEAAFHIHARDGVCSLKIAGVEVTMNDRNTYRSVPKGKDISFVWCANGQVQTIEFKPIKPIKPLQDLPG
jgi:hypothetical protein